MKIKNWKKFNEETTGNIELNIDGKKSYWYFIEDAINNGILEQYLDLDGDLVEEYNEEYWNLESLTDDILQDFETELDKLFDFCLAKDIIDKKPELIEIEGEDEDEEYWEFSYYKNNI